MTDEILSSCPYLTYDPFTKRWYCNQDSLSISRTKKGHPCSHVSADKITDCARTISGQSGNDKGIIPPIIQGVRPAHGSCTTSTRYSRDIDGRR